MISALVFPLSCACILQHALVCTYKPLVDTTNPLRGYFGTSVWISLPRSALRMKPLSIGTRLRRLVSLRLLPYPCLGTRLRRFDTFGKATSFRSLALCPGEFLITLCFGTSPGRIAYFGKVTFPFPRNIVVGEVLTTACFGTRLRRLASLKRFSSRGSALATAKS